MHTPRILLIVTSASRMGQLPKPTGSWLEEVVAPYYTFVDAKCDITVASPLGGSAPIDPESLEEANQTASTRRFDSDEVAQAALAQTLPLSAIDPASYDALYFAGGHGTMEDFPTAENVRAIVERFYATQKPIASVCHGPACLVSARKGDGSPLVAGHRFTCFSDAEETHVGLAECVPFMLESRLTELGGLPRTAAPFAAHVVVDGSLLTGQNPASAIPLAEAVIYQLRARGKSAA